MADGEKYEIISLTFFRDWHELAKKNKLSDEQYGAVIRAMCEYSFYEIDTDLENAEGIIFDMSKPYIKSSNQKKLEGHKGGSQGKGGAPKGNNNASKKKE